MVAQNSLMYFQDNVANGDQWIPIQSNTVTVSYTVNISKQQLPDHVNWFNCWISES